MLTPILAHTVQQLVGSENLTLFRRDRIIRDTTILPDEFDNYLSLDCMTVQEAKKRFTSIRAKLLPHFDYGRLVQRYLNLSLKSTMNESEF